MISDVLPNLYSIEIPLPRSPLKALNSYVIKGPERNLIIDTGMNREECRSAMLSALRRLGVDLTRTDFFITHVHADHLGLISALASASSKVYFSRADADLALASSIGWEPMLEYARRNGFPNRQLHEALDRHPGYKYGPQDQPDFTFLREGDTITAGEYRFECVETPGHTRGHMCLYEPNRKILVSGDHILGDITPNISLWRDGNENPLRDYLASLDKIYALEISLVLPGHRRIFGDCRGRILQLKHHHQVRANEALAALMGGARDAFHVAAEMTWDLKADSWDDIPAPQKWFAMGEALAHLKYLEGKGLIQRDMLAQGPGASLYVYRSA